MLHFFNYNGPFNKFKVSQKRKRMAKGQGCNWCMQLKPNGVIKEFRSTPSAGFEKTDYSIIRDK